MTEVIACLRGIQIAAASNPNKSFWIEADSKLIVDWININSAPPFFFKVELVQLKLMLCCPSLVQEKARTFF